MIKSVEQAPQNVWDEICASIQTDVDAEMKSFDAHVREYEAAPVNVKTAQKVAKADDSKPLAVSPDQDLPGRATAETDIETVVVAALDTLREKVTAPLVSAYENGQTAEQVADALDLSALDEVAVPVGDALKAVAVKAARKALVSLEITDKGLFNLANENAAAFARDRGAELVGRKWVDGELVENPDARWAITESTRDKVRDLVERAYTDGMTPAELKTEIEASTEFSAGRAKLIAKTETAKASVSGTIQGWQASGLVTGKQSLLSDDHDIDDECNDAAEEGAIPLEDEFSTGDFCPPYHPGCNCSLIAVLAKK